jgi:hypothetical protein
MINVVTPDLLYDIGLGAVVDRMVASNDLLIVIVVR